MSNVIQHITLKELANRVKQAIQSSFSNEVFWVVAEISGHKHIPRDSRHYLDLVEKIEGQNVEAAKIKSIIWSENADCVKLFETQTGQEFKNGLQVLVKLKVEYNIVHGLSANILDIDASYTLGNIEKQKLQTLMRLVTENPDKIVQEGENYVTFNKQLKLSIVLQRIALVTSQNSEGLHDFLNCILANRFGYKFAVDNFFTSVQGIQAEADLRNKMLEIYNSGVKYDCVVIIRGGGAKTDFAVFDTYGIARAVARFPFPVFTGIGHLRDVSITDMMAHTVSNTPTKAAELIIAHNRKFEEAVIQLQRTLVIKTQQFCALRNQSLNGINTKIVNESRNRLQEKNNFLQNLKQAVVQKSRLLLSSNNNNLTYVFSNLKTSIPFVIKQKNDDLKILNNIIPQAITNIFKYQVDNLQHLSSIIRLSNPKNILKKGFVLIKQNGGIKTTASQIKIGDELNLIFSDAEVVTTVKKINNEEHEL